MISLTKFKNATLPFSNSCFYIYAHTHTHKHYFILLKSLKFNVQLSPTTPPNTTYFFFVFESLLLIFLGYFVSLSMHNTYLHYIKHTIDKQYKR